MHCPPSWGCRIRPGLAQATDMTGSVLKWRYRGWGTDVQARLPEAIVHPQLQQLQGRDEAKLALLWHVEVIYEGNKLLASSWAKHTLHTLTRLAQTKMQV